MATTVTKEFRFDSDNAETYAEAEMNVLNRDGNFVRLYLNNTKDEDIYLKQVGKNQLFPTSTAKPYRLDHSMRYRRTVGGTSHFYFYIDGTEIHHTSTTSNDYTTNDKTNITVSAVTNCTSASEFKWYVAAQRTTNGALLLWDKFIFYFYQYTCGASAGTGISSATIDNASPYNGDPITFTCEVAPGYNFDGWYNGSTKVSSSQTYTMTAGSDLTLTAKGTEIQSFIYIKNNGAWQKAKALYKKVNGAWVEQTTPPTGYTKILRKHNPWTFDKSFRQDSIVDDTTWLISDYIAVTPNVELIVTGQGGDTNNTMWQAYYSNKTFYDHWGGSGTTIATVGGRPVYQRTLSADNMANTYWVRVGAFKEAWNYIKVVQNGATLFDGSQYPYK